MRAADKKAKRTDDGENRGWKRWHVQIEVEQQQEEESRRAAVEQQEEESRIYYIRWPLKREKSARRQVK